MKNTIIIALTILIIFLTGYIYYQEIPKYITVEIKGAVENTGVYKLKKGSTVSDLITASGGPKENTDIDIINLSKELHSEDVVVLYTKEEIKPSITYAEYECICPNIKNVGELEAIIDNNIVTTKKVNINSSTIEELMTLSGIGEAKAKKIIEYRTNKKFSKIEEIMEVSGIGESMYEKIKDYITI